MNKIIINNKNVKIETDIVYKAIELYYDGELYIENLLPSDYIVQKGDRQIIIIRFNRNDEILKELFNYDGYCNIFSAYLIDQENLQVPLIIEKPAALTWEKMGTRKNSSNEERKVDWEYMTTSYNDMDNTGRNDYIKSFKFKRTVDDEGRTKTGTKELSRKLSLKNKKDINLTTLESLGVKTKEIKKATKTRQKIKRGY
tara:strand:+ start:3965 stop:4561 length:597 start_codon:yes stop_codon:yes gene_type:complete